MKNVKKYITYS